MRQKEKILFFELCNFNRKNSKKLNKLIEAGATPTVLGHLFFNRMAASAYGELKKLGMLGKVNREFRNSLKIAYDQSIEKNNSYYTCVKLLSEILKNANVKYAMLKGAILCNIYPEGYRTANDVDLLVRSEDVSQIGELLTSAGFKQGYIRDGEFVKATRKEIIESKMTRGETVPYILEVNLPEMRFFEVDINFSLDYKNSDSNNVEDMLSRTKIWEVGGLEIMSLNKYDFFIHLCCHLYKEATTLPWVKMKRDMTLYKFSDIYMLLSKFIRTDIWAMFTRADELGLAEICSCVILWTTSLFNIKNDYAIEMSNSHLQGKRKMLLRVIFPSENKEYEYIEENIRKRFFANDRMELLKEVQK